MTSDDNELGPLVRLDYKNVGRKQKKKIEIKYCTMISLRQ